MHYRHSFFFKKAGPCGRLPAEVKTISLVLLPNIHDFLNIWIKQRHLTAKGCVVAFYIFEYAPLYIGYIDPAPIIPKPPALETAAAKRQPLHQIIPACIIGYLMLNNELITLAIRSSFTCLDFMIFDSERSTKFTPGFLPISKLPIVAQYLKILLRDGCPI